MLGYLLARSGVDVVVLEKWPDFFRDFRGDTIHPSTMEVLHELGLLEEFLKLPHNETHQMSGHIGGEEIMVANFDLLGVRTPYIAFIPQWDFLNFLSAKAKAYPQFHLMMETEATDIITEGGNVVGLRAKNKTGEVTIKAELVVGADGRHSTVREKSQLAVEDYGAPIDVLWFRLPRSDDGTQRSFGYINGGRIMIMLDRDEYWQCGFIIHKGDFEHIQAQGLDAFKKNIVLLNPLLSSAVEELKSFEQVKMLSVAVDHLLTWYREGFLCIGDSAHAMSPVGGVGINYAIQDAVAAANILVPAFKRGTPTVADLAAVQARREVPARRMQKLQVLLHRRMIEPALNHKGKTRLPWFVRLALHTPLLRSIPARIVGIGFQPEHVSLEQRPSV